MFYLKTKVNKHRTKYIIKVMQKNDSHSPIIHCISINLKPIYFFFLHVASLLPFPSLSFLGSLEYSIGFFH